jgi:hypothetical protein
MGSWILEKWSYHTCHSFFSIFLGCRFQGEGQGKKADLWLSVVSFTSNLSGQKRYR